jgi:hypothetical protein
MSTSNPLLLLSSLILGLSEPITSTAEQTTSATEQRRSTTEQATSTTGQATSTTEQITSTIGHMTSETGTIEKQTVTQTIIGSDETVVQSDVISDTSLGAIPHKTTVFVVGTSSTMSTVPLFTAFIPPTSCINRYYMWVSINTELQGTVWSGSPDRKYEECQPKTSPVVYSPAMCPENMMAATAALNGSVYTDRCCEKGFSLDGDGCYSFVTRTTNVLMAPIISTSDVYTTISSVIARHTMFDVFWKSADLTVFPSAEAARLRGVMASLAGSQTATASISAAPTQTPSDRTEIIAAPPQAPLGRTDMSTEVKIRIGVGVTVVSLIIMLFVSAWIVKFMRRRRLAPRGGAKELDSDYTSIWKRFMGSAWRAEMANDPLPAELDVSEHETQPAEESNQRENQEAEGLGQVIVHGVFEMEGSNYYSNPEQRESI